MNPLYYPLPNRIARTVLQPIARWMPEAVKFPVYGPVRVQLPGGEAIEVDCNPTSFLGKRLFWHGFTGFEGALAGVFIRLIRESNVFVDVGGNIGYYSLVAAAVNPEIRVISFEPLPAAFRYLERNVALNGFDRIEAEQVALSDTNGEATFHVSRKTKYSAIENHLVATSSFDREQAGKTGPVETIRVQTRTLDAYEAASIQQRIDVLKLDTEGTEDRVLAGAHRVLTEHRPTIFCEVLPGQIEADLTAIFHDYDYRLFRIEPSGLHALDQLDAAPGRSNDHLMLPAESAEARIAQIRRARVLP